jgi:hypothetical protein
MLIQPQERKKSPIFFLLIFFSRNPRKKSRFFDVFTVKLCIIIRNLPENYLNLIRNQDQEITLREPGIRVCLGGDVPSASSSCWPYLHGGAGACFKSCYAACACGTKPRRGPPAALPGEDVWRHA